MVFLAALSYGLIEGPPPRLQLSACSRGARRRHDQRDRFRACRAGFTCANAPFEFVRQPAVLGHQCRDPGRLRGTRSSLFLIPVELQVVNHYTPLESGTALIPLTVVMLLLSARSGQLAARIGPRLQMGSGPVVVGVGLALLTGSTGSDSYASGVLPAMLVLALGLAITVAPLTTTALGAAPSEHAGIASGVNNYVARVGSLLAVAVLPAVAGISGQGYVHPRLLATGFAAP